ncbi:hypothetical protein CHARACLAT_029517 [Characodon lateralis]|uniref:Uncharacterized protein n=1 Tax=Characodon lateralis TaxID=208331 RepID=A0ABU7DKX5_9TELE|nr:hypothetical protein [Characodon lateralis]
MLNLVDPMDRSVLHSQPIASIRVWGVGRDNGRLVAVSKQLFSEIYFLFPAIPIIIWALNAVLQITFNLSVGISFFVLDVFACQYLCVLYSLYS